MTDREVVIVDAVRTPIGKGHRDSGWLRDHHPADLLGAVFAALINRSELPPSPVGDVIEGCVLRFKCQESRRLALPMSTVLQA